MRKRLSKGRIPFQRSAVDFGIVDNERCEKVVITSCISQMTHQHQRRYGVFRVELSDVYFLTNKTIVHVQRVE